MIGPQVGYYVPQILMEEDLHGPGIDARGAAFAGVNLFVQLGHGRDYAWSATTATSDNVDTFAEVLCKDEFHYSYRGKCLPMEKLEQDRELDAERDRPDRGRLPDPDRLPHRARDRLRPRQGQRQEGRLRPPAQHLLPRGRLGDRVRPAERTGRRHRAVTASRRRSRTSTSSSTGPTSTPNTSPTPSRARCRSGRPGTSPDFPILGTGKFDWKGFNPATQPATYLPFSKHPQAVDPDYLVSWNNKQAPGWAAADDKYSYGPLFRSQMISDRVKAAIKGGKKMTISQLSRRWRKPATQDLRGYRLLPTLFKAIGKPKSARSYGSARDAGSLADARRPQARPESRRSRRGNAAVELMDAWWPKLLKAEFKPALGKKAYERLRGDARDRRLRRRLAEGPGLRGRLVGLRLQGPARPVRPEAEGALEPRLLRKRLEAKCRDLLQQTLGEAVKVTPAALYGGGNGKCAADPQPSCFDQNRPLVTGGIALGPFPFQNRPTFQQVVTLTQKLPR